MYPAEFDSASLQMKFIRRKAIFGNTTGSDLQCSSTFAPVRVYSLITHRLFCIVDQSTA